MLNLNVELNSVELRGKAAAAFAEANQYFLVNFQWGDVVDALQRLWVIAKPWLQVLAVLTVKTFVIVAYAVAFVAVYGYEVAGRMLRGNDELNAAIDAFDAFDAFVAIAESDEDESEVASAAAVVAGAEVEIEVIEEVMDSALAPEADGLVVPSVEEAEQIELVQRLDVELGIEEVVPVASVAPAKTKRSNRSKKTAAAVATIPVEDC